MNRHITHFYASWVIIIIYVLHKESLAVQILLKQRDSRQTQANAQMPIMAKSKIIGSEKN